MMSGAADWLREHRLAVRQLATGAWVRFTEEFSAAPRLYQKLAGQRPQRKPLVGHRDTLEKGGRSCFYCGRDDAPSYEVDHFLPWSFVFEDRLWNLVLACGGSSGCNQRKRDGIPSDDDLDRLNRRNEGQFLTAAHREPGTCHAHFKEWLHRDLMAHLRQLRATALSEGFPNWAVSTAT
jgi:5-methylcytosine-specific restriction endonuclease McrA